MDACRKAALYGELNDRDAAWLLDYANSIERPFEVGRRVRYLTDAKAVVGDKVEVTLPRMSIGVISKSEHHAGWAEAEDWYGLTLDGNIYRHSEDVIPCR